MSSGGAQVLHHLSRHHYIAASNDSLKIGFVLQVSNSCFQAFFSRFLESFFTVIHHQDVGFFRIAEASSQCTYTAAQVYHISPLRQNSFDTSVHLPQSIDPPLFLPLLCPQAIPKVRAIGRSGRPLSCSRFSHIRSGGLEHHIWLPRASGRFFGQVV